MPVGPLNNALKLDYKTGDYNGKQFGYKNPFQGFFFQKFQFSNSKLSQMEWIRREKLVYKKGKWDLWKVITYS